MIEHGSAQLALVLPCALRPWWLARHLAGLTNRERAGDWDGSLIYRPNQGRIARK
jgi:hypothetical protein